MADAECIHGLGPVAACTICNGREKRQERDRRTIERLWSALFAGICAVCHQPFDVGDPIGRNSLEEYVCGDCAVTA